MYHRPKDDTHEAPSSIVRSSSVAMLLSSCVSTSTSPQVKKSSSRRTSRRSTSSTSFHQVPTISTPSASNETASALITATSPRTRTLSPTHPPQAASTSSTSAPTETTITTKKSRHSHLANLRTVTLEDCSQQEIQRNHGGNYNPCRCTIR